MDLRQLQYFLQLCEDKTFSKAAATLYLTHQGLNKAIKALEEELGVSLYYKDKRVVVLTKAGQELSRQAKILLQDADLLNKKMAAFTKLGERKLVRVACAFAVYGELYTGLFSTLNTAFPEITLEFSEYPDLLCEEAILKEEADIGFSIGPFVQENLIAEPLLKHNLCLLVNKKNPLSKCGELFCKDLQNEKILIANENFKIYHCFWEQCHQAGFEPNIVFKGSEISSIHSLSAANKGVAVTVDFVGAYPGCKTIPFETEVLNWMICLIVKKNRADDKPIGDILQYVREHK